MCKDDHNHMPCCLQGPEGVPGLQGQQGIQGVPGAQGSTGLSGAQGPQGLQGIPGKDCDNSGRDCCELRYANLYASLPLQIGAYASATDAVTFDAQNAVSAGDFDLSAMGSTGEIKFLKHGIYNIQWILQARITPPIPTPVPSWSFGLWLNGALVPGSIYSGYTQSPDDDAAHSNASVIIELKAGDSLKLRNTCVSMVSLNPIVTGSVFPITIASLVIESLKMLP